MTTFGDIVGREPEVGRILEFIGRIRDGPAALVLEGEAGIGKTTLWQVGVSAASQHRYQTLSCRPAESESSLSFVALSDLLDGVSTKMLPKLPSPQRRALELALLIRDPVDEPPDHRAIGAATHRILTLLAASGPVLIAVDDVQWMDPPSSRALEFALRRIKEDPIGVLLAKRGAGHGPTPLGIDRALSGHRDVRLTIGSLSLGAVQRLLHSQFDTRLARPVLTRLYAVCGGNPFFALEIVRAMRRSGVAPHPGHEFPVPENLADLVRGRLAALRPKTREVLLAAAAQSHPTLVGLDDIFGSDLAEAALSEAREAGVIRTADDLVYFTHPLLSSVLASQFGRRHKRELHRRLAEEVTDTEQRARHLAQAASGPDAHTAGILESAAGRARARGAVDSAAELAGLAHRLTPPNLVEDARQRTIAEADYAWQAGDTARAGELLDQVVRTTTPGPLRAPALLLLGTIYFETRGARDATTMCERALGEAGDNPKLLSRIHSTIAWVCYYDNPRRITHARAAVALLESVDDPEPNLMAQALAGLVEAEYYVGNGVPMDLVQRAIQLEERAPRARVAERAWVRFGQFLKYMDDFEGARIRLEAAYKTAQQEGDESSLPDLLSHLAELELWTGNWDRARRYARDCFELAEQTEQKVLQSVTLFVLANVDAHAGRTESARKEAEDGLALAETVEDPWAIGTNLWALGFLEVSLGNMAAADDALTRADDIGETIGLGEPGQWRFHADHIEALISLGALDRAERLLDRLEERGRRLQRPWALATSARCRALLAGAHGDMDTAVAEADRALAEHDRRLAMPFELGRTLLVRGAIERRAQRKRPARDALERALQIFEDLGALLWVDKARGELARIGGRRSTPGTLTPTEQQVAEAVAGGLTNREAADALFLSVKTVEANLTRIYRKLGLRSRTELARWVAHGDP